ncbi:hypothetical protein [Maribacter hydrothermalis]|uniref:Lipocalin-like domain-containing protein n=1 Tax=Maribacter hydrothermalis TaxID=1836467 RepID=A0A1B7Z8X5_9FLAO|nr:hypothetical protein [Maribacter hydrothermalis]APQ18977.1 hypothetical protein BTR34_17340 [Maribacter hydrothermalis]OBR39010.1 hypothetical protein A9200_04935 [Maribacter hydrothermalis]
MKNLISFFKKSLLLVSTLLLVISCSDDDTTKEEVSLTQTELKAMLETDDITGGIDLALYDLYTNTGSSGKTMSNECYSAVYSDTGYVATFNNCVLNGTENVNGTLSVTYNQQGETGSFTASYVDFYVGEIKINGSRSFTFSTNSNDSSITFQVTSEMTVEKEDGSIISDNGTKSTTIAFGNTTSYSISGSWTVVFEGNTYNVTVNNPLTSEVTCNYVSSGDMDVSKNGLSVNVDFGDSTCDNVAIMTYPNGVKEEIVLKD